MIYMRGYEATVLSLHKWTQEVFEKLGWMVYLQHKIMRSS